MSLRRVLLALAVAALAPLPLSAEDLRDLLTNLIRNGLTLAPPADPSICNQVPVPGTCHVAHFSGDAIFRQATAVTAFSTQLANQLSTFPVPSSSGGFTYTYDPKLGTFSRGAQSFGPIYAERADTIGRNRLNVGINYSHFSYDRINEFDLDSGDLKLLFLHADPNPQPNGRLSPWFQGDVVSGPLRLKVKSDIAAFVATYGLGERFDIGIAVPFVNVSLDAETDLTIERLSTTDPRDETVHQFVGGGGSEPLRTSGSASGIGDVFLRTKWRLTASPRAGVALATDVRFPTGKEEDLLGTGVTQIKAFLIASAHFGNFSPHVNGGYTWAIHRCAGQRSVSECQTPGAPAYGTGVPDEINYTGGFDWAFGPGVTFVADVIGRTFRNTQLIGIGTTTLEVNTDRSCTAANCTIDPSRIETHELLGLTAPTGNLNTLLGSVGFKINPVGSLLITVNGLFSITKKGLQDRFTPLVAIDYAF